ncbi:LysR family transcriptional regulator [Lactiplantibacillus carotarum]|uniref:LysR family transcriptional regulator n=1 Tax=Lactiplantibacillus carotarum TaxID=2993456 RepID=UPI00298F3B9B|nr:LysR family transcriptional regulator [Lactiplantibacillus carotarum]
MNTRDLALFRAVVKTKNYTQVAEQFHVSQPAVTQAIKRLEREFDAPLIKQDHTHQQMLITHAGQLLYNNSQAVHDSLELAHREIDAAKQPQIRFGLPPIIGALFFPQVAKPLLAWGWLKQLNVVERGSAEILDDLAHGKLDIALVASAHPLHLHNVQTVSLGTRPFEVIVSTDNPLAQRDRISFQELADQPFIGLDDSFIHPRAFRDFCQAAGVKPQILYQTADIAWMKSIVRANLGLGFLVKDAIFPNEGIVGLTITDSLREQFHIAVAYRKGYALSEREASLLQILLKIKV